MASKTDPLELTDRFTRFLEIIEEHGGTYQRHRDLFVEEVGCGTDAFNRMAARAEELGVVEIERTGHPMVGVGRFPNTYTLKMSVARWLEVREDVAWDRRDENRRAGARRAVVTQRVMRRRAAEKAEEEEYERAMAIMALPQLPDETPSTEPRVVRGVDLEAWDDFADF